MKKLTRLFLYIKYFFEPKDKEVRKMAYEAAKAYYSVRPLRSRKNPYPRVVEYNQRREDFSAYQRAYNNSYRHGYAMSKLNEMTIR